MVTYFLASAPPPQVCRYWSAIKFNEQSVLEVRQSSLLYAIYNSYILHVTIPTSIVIRDWLFRPNLVHQLKLVAYLSLTIWHRSHVMLLIHYISYSLSNKRNVMPRTTTTLLRNYETANIAVILDFPQFYFAFSDWYSFKVKKNCLFSYSHKMWYHNFQLSFWVILL